MGDDKTGESKSTYLVLWWLNQVPYVARFEDEIEAETAAKVRNAVVIEVKGTAFEVGRIVDYYRRDDEGNPMPATWKELANNIVTRAVFRWPTFV